MKKTIYFAGRLAIALYVLITIFILTVAYTPLSNKMAASLAIKDHVEKVDVIAVLGSGVYDNGALTKNATERVVRGVIVYNKLKSAKMFFSGGSKMAMGSKLTHTILSAKADETSSGVTEALSMKTLAVQLGVKEADIGIDDESHSTYENILGLRKYMKEHGMKKCAIVTSTTHAHRAVLTAQKAGLDCESAAVPDYTMYRNGPLDRLNLFYETSWEYAGLVIYKLKGYI